MKQMQLIDRIHDVMARRLAEKGEVSLALSGGSSPVRLYQDMSTLDLNWADVTVTLIDDRQVPANHADSNQRLISETLLTDRARQATFIPLENWPVDRIPDIAVLGMGTDGHFASLFPSMLDQAEAFDPDASPAVIKTGPEGNPRHERITMTMAMILAIPFRVMLALDEEKQAVLKAAMDGEDLPISRLFAHDGTEIITEGV